MRVRVLDAWKDVLSTLIANRKNSPNLSLSAKKEYVVYGLSWHQHQLFYDGQKVLCELVNDYGNLISVPIDILSVVDSRVPDIWRIEKRDGSVFLWPEIFLERFFFDDFSEGLPEAVKAFRSLQVLLGDDRQEAHRIGGR